MTIATTAAKIVYIGDAATVAFPYNFKIFADGDLVVTEKLIASPYTETVKTITTDYTVSGAGDATGGTVTMVTAPASTVKLIIKRTLTLTQSFNLVENDNSPSNSFEEAYDKLTAMVQQMQEQLDRSIIQSIDNTAKLTFPSASASKGIAWNSDADGLENVTLLDSSAVAAAAASAASASSSASSASSSASSASASAAAAAASAATIDLTAPGAIGGTTPAAGTFTTLIGTNIDGIIGANTPAAGSFTTLSLTNTTTTTTLEVIKSGVAGGHAITVANSGTSSGIFVNQIGVLTGNDRGLLVSSAVAQTTDELVEFALYNGSSDKGVVIISNYGTGPGLTVNQGGAGNGFNLTNHSTKKGLFLNNTGVIDAGNIALDVYSSTEQDAGTALVRFGLASGDSSIVTLKIGQSGSGSQVLGEGNENLSNAGVWTDRASTYAEKTNITDLDVAGFADKLKNCKLFRYQKKCEVYGNRPSLDNKGKEIKEEEKEYSNKVRTADAPYHIGHILDDPTTPDELVSRDAITKEINGLSAQHGVHFLLAVCKDLINRIEVLEKA